MINCSYVNSSLEFMNDFAYLSQVFQAIGMQAESEHYRRYRSTVLPDGRGGTMCALYWQLNDVWAAPTWSSIDSDLNWKVLQYYAKRFFALVIVSLVSTGWGGLCLGTKSIALAQPTVPYSSENT